MRTSRSTSGSFCAALMLPLHDHKIVNIALHIPHRSVVILRNPRNVLPPHEQDEL